MVESRWLGLRHHHISNLITSFQLTNTSDEYSQTLTKHDLRLLESLISSSTSTSLLSSSQSSLQIDRFLGKNVNIHEMEGIESYPSYQDELNLMYEEHDF